MRCKESTLINLQALHDYFGKDCVGIGEVSDYLKTDRRTLLKDKTFPAKSVGGKYVVTVASLALWLTN